MFRLVPIKLPGTNLKFPSVAAPGEEALQQIADSGFSVSSRSHQSYAYLTMFSGIVPAGRNDRVSFAVHGDQRQSLEPENRHLIDYTYVVSDEIPTTFYEQAFDLRSAQAVHKSGTRVDLYHTLAAQADERQACYSKNYAIYLLDPYVVNHTSECVDARHRLLLKVVFSSQRLFDRRESFRNPDLNYAEWFRVAATTPEFLPFNDPNTACTRNI